MEVRFDPIYEEQWLSGDSLQVSKESVDIIKVQCAGCNQLLETPPGC